VVYLILKSFSTTRTPCTLRVTSTARLALSLRRQTAQLNTSFKGLDANFRGLNIFIVKERRFHLRGHHGIVNIAAGTFLCGDPAQPAKGRRPAASRKTQVLL
jgi:hypothetical protein